VWDKEGARGTPSKYKTTGRYTKGSQCGPVGGNGGNAMEMRNKIILILNNSTSPPAMLDNGGSSELMRTTDKRNRRAVAQAMLVKMLRFKQQD
jgi:hypothetical protein